MQHSVLIQARCKPILVQRLDQLVAQSTATNRSDDIRALIEKELYRLEQEQQEAPQTVGE